MSTYKDKQGYKRNHSNLVHRQRAYRGIYLENPDKYKHPFGYYEIHHIDKDKHNNKISNLLLVSPKQHDELHDIIDLTREFFLDYRNFSIFSALNVFLVILGAIIMMFNAVGVVSIIAGVYLIFKRYEKKKLLKGHYQNTLDLYYNLVEEIEAGDKVKSKKEKKYSCLDCNRSLSHKGRCLPCNVKRKRIRDNGGWEKVNQPKSWILKKAKKQRKSIVKGKHYRYKIVKEGNKKIVYRKKRK